MNNSIILQNVTQEQLHETVRLAVREELQTLCNQKLNIQRFRKMMIQC
jgi:hypothetical protein